MEDLITQYGGVEGVLRLIEQYLLWGWNGTAGAEAVGIMAVKLGVPSWAVMRVAKMYTREKKSVAYDKDYHLVHLREEHDEEG